MTKKLYDKREELRAIFGRDSIKRVFKNWVDYVFVMVQAAPVAGIVAGNHPSHSVIIRANRLHALFEYTTFSGELTFERFDLLKQHRPQAWSR
jgi:hypothetical protein